MFLYVLFQCIWYCRAIRPKELVGLVWTKEEKEKTSPNVLRIIHHSDKVKLYGIEYTMHVHLYGRYLSGWQSQ